MKKLNFLSGFIVFLLAFSCGFYDDLEVRLYVEDAYSSLGNDYVTIRYDYKPGYNTVAVLDLYEYGQNPYIDRYINTYTLEEGVDLELALEDADSRLYEGGDVKGFRLEIVPLQSRAGEESPFNFYRGDSYLFLVDRRTNGDDFGNFGFDPMLYSQFQFENFQGSDWETLHSTVYARVWSEQDAGGFDTYSYHYRYDVDATPSDPVAEDGFVPIPSEAEELWVTVVNAMGTYRPVPIITAPPQPPYENLAEYNFASNTPPFEYEPLSPLYNLLSPDHLTKPFPSDFHPGQFYHIEYWGQNISWSTIPYMIYEGKRHLPSFRHFERGGDVILELEFTVPAAITLTSSFGLYLSNPAPLPSPFGPADELLSSKEVALDNEVGS
jgi:hypothetical protein